MRPLNSLPPSIIALLLQCASLMLVWLLVRTTGINGSLLQLAGLSAVLASVLSYFAGLAPWWWLIQLVFAPILVLTLSMDLPPNLFLFAFLILLLTYWSNYRTQVPLFLSNHQVLGAIQRLLPPDNPDHTLHFIDLGSGLGGVLTFLAKARPNGLYSGIEAAPLPFMWSWIRIRMGGYHNCKVDWGDLWRCNLSQYDVVFAYLSPVPMEKLWQKARAEMSPGALFISSTFSVPDQSPHEVIHITDTRHSTLLIWRM